MKSFLVNIFALLAVGLTFQNVSAEVDLSKLNLSSLQTFFPDFVKTTRDKINSVSNHNFNEWLKETIDKDINDMMRAANHMMHNNLRIFGDMLFESNADLEKKSNLTMQLDGVMIQTTNEIAAESLKAHRLLFNHQSIIGSYEKFSVDLFRKNALEHTEHVVFGVQRILAHLFGTLNIFSSTAILAIDTETKAVIEGRPTRFELMHEPHKMKTAIDGLENMVPNANSAAAPDKPARSQEVKKDSSVSGATSPPTADATVVKKDGSKKKDTYTDDLNMDSDDDTSSKDLDVITI